MYTYRNVHTGHTISSATVWPRLEALPQWQRADMVQRRAPVESPAEEAPDEVPPLAMAPKAEWIRYAIDQGMDQDDAEALTKAELVEKFR